MSDGVQTPAVRDARIVAVPMREECKHYQSRTYATGEVARSASSTSPRRHRGAALRTAPRYERRFADVGWEHGTLIEPPIEDEPTGDPGEIAELLDTAEDIVNASLRRPGRKPSRKQAEEERKRDRRRWPWPLPPLRAEPTRQDQDPP